MRTLHIVMPMAGLGSRFMAENYHLPKPLIAVKGAPMFVTALGSFNNLDIPKDYTFIVRKEHVTSYKIDQIIKDHIPTANIVITDDAPIGAAVDCFKAKPHVKPEQSVVFLDCDLYFQSRSYNQILNDCLNNQVNQPVAGAVLYFNSDKDRYSFVRVDKGMAIETAEKKVISNNAIAGAYFFNWAKLIFDNLDEYVSRQLLTGTKEYYISPIYNKYIKDNLQIKACPVDEYSSFGTPEELDNYEKHH